MEKTWRLVERLQEELLMKAEVTMVDVVEEC
jgi:hypothetical protein